MSKNFKKKMSKNTTSTRMAAKLEASIKTEISSDFLKKILQHLKYSICNDNFEEKFMIDCGHTFRSNVSINGEKGRINGHKKSI